MNWPQNEDGDVFRRLQEDGFDFSKEVEIEFNISFDTWPIPEETNQYLKKRFPDGVLIHPDEDDFAQGIDKGYFSFVVKDKLSYELVMDIQKKVTEEMKPLGGQCNEWGVLSF